MLTGKGNVHSVYLCHHNISAANAASAKRYCSSVFGSQSDLCCIGVGVIKVCCVDFHKKPFFFRFFKGKTNTLIVRLHSQDSGNDRFVCAVTFICFCKGTVKKNGSPDRRLSKECARDKSNSGCTCGMRTGRTDHHRSENIKNVHKFNLRI